MKLPRILQNRKIVELHGIMTGDMRHGPVIVELFEDGKCMSASTSAMQSFGLAIVEKYSI